MLDEGSGSLYNTKGLRGGHPTGVTIHPSMTHMVHPTPTVIWMRARAEPLNQGLTHSRDAQSATQTVIPPCPNKLRVKGEAPQSGTYTLSNAQSALSYGGESKGRAPPIGESYTLEKLSQPLTRA
jgi:hypothetical protein